MLHNCIMNVVKYCGLSSEFYSNRYMYIYNHIYVYIHGMG